MIEINAYLAATKEGEVIHYEDLYRLCYIRGPEGMRIINVDIRLTIY